MTNNELTHEIIGGAIEVHRLLGPGLLESAYEECLAKELTLRKSIVERQKPVPVVYKDVKLECGYRICWSRAELWSSLSPSRVSPPYMRPSFSPTYVFLAVGWGS
jgi:hypothetical protein